jgi:hypothetical protein
MRKRSRYSERYKAMNYLNSALLVSLSPFLPFINHNLAHPQLQHRPLQAVRLPQRVYTFVSECQPPHHNALVHLSFMTVFSFPLHLSPPLSVRSTARSAPLPLRQSRQNQPPVRATATGSSESASRDRLVRNRLAPTVSSESGKPATDIVSMSDPRQARQNRVWHASCPTAATASSE